MRVHVRNALAFLVIAVLVGCATPNVGRDFTLKPDSKSGLATGSITRTVSDAGEKGMTAYTAYAMLQFRAVGGGTSGKLESGSPSLGKLYSSELEGVEGHTFAVELPAGQYEFYTWSLNTGGLTVSPKQEMSIPFEVSSGKATYIGDIGFDVIFGKALFGNAAFSDVSIKVKDSSIRDIPYLSKMFPKLNADDIQKRIATSPTSSGSAKRE